MPVAAQAQTTPEIQALIDSFTLQIAQLTAQLNALTGGSVGGSTANCNFTRSLAVSLGSVGDDVMCLQKYLNSAGFQVSATGQVLQEMKQPSSEAAPKQRFAWQKRVAQQLDT